MMQEFKRVAKNSLNVPNFRLAKIDLSVNEIMDFRITEPSLLYWPAVGDPTILTFTKWTELKMFLACNSPMYRDKFSYECVGGAANVTTLGTIVTDEL